MPFLIWDADSNVGNTRLPSLLLNVNAAYDRVDEYSTAIDNTSLTLHELVRPGGSLTPVTNVLECCISFRIARSKLA